MTRPPVLTPQTQKRAVAQASEARKVRANIKQAIAAGEISIFSVILDPRIPVQRMRIFELLSSVPGVGDIRARAIMERAKISSSRRIMGLGKHQLFTLRKELALTKVRPPIGSLVVMSGPGGVGKSTITAALRSDPRFWVSVSATTREPRPDERDGIDYFFLTDAKFDRMVVEGQFLEWAEFAGARYGTPKAPIEEWRAVGINVLLEIEIEGARQVRAAESSALLIFISPPSWEELAVRLEGRGTDSPQRRQARLALAAEEMVAASEFDHILVNHEVGEVLSQLVSLATSHDVS